MADLTQAATALIRKRVIATTTAAPGTNQISGTLKVAGSDFIDIEWATGKSTLIPFAALASLKEE